MTVRHLIELQIAVIEHCSGLREVADLLRDVKSEAAIARLDGAVAELERTVGKHYRDTKVRLRAEELKRKKGNGR